jgi:hypothetical protein
MLPVRLAGAALIAAVIYLAWVNRDDVRRWVHRATTEPAPPPDSRMMPAELLARAAARLDSLARRRADSVTLTPKEVEAVVGAEVSRRAGAVADSITVRLDDGTVTVRARVDAAKLPATNLGPLSEWLAGRQTVSVSGPIGLLRVGTGEWRIDQVVVRGLPVPKALWERLLGMVIPGAKAGLTFPVDRWISGVRVSSEGVVLYGGAGER